MSGHDEPLTDYVHRLNPDGTVDSICRHCCRTVGHEMDELKLDEAEADHICKVKSARRKRSKK